MSRLVMRGDRQVPAAHPGRPVTDGAAQRHVPRRGHRTHRLGGRPARPSL